MSRFLLPTQDPIDVLIAAFVAASQELKDILDVASLPTTLTAAQLKINAVWAGLTQDMLDSWPIEQRLKVQLFSNLLALEHLFCPLSAGITGERHQSDILASQEARCWMALIVRNLRALKSPFWQIDFKQMILTVLIGAFGCSGGLKPEQVMGSSAPFRIPVNKQRFLPEPPFITIGYQPPPPPPPPPPENPPPPPEEEPGEMASFVRRRAD